MLTAATMLLRRAASTSAPAGTWLAMEVAVPRLRAKPIARLRPALRRQIDDDERAEAGLDIGDEEVEPVQPALGGARHRRRQTGVAGLLHHAHDPVICCYRRRRRPSAGGGPTICIGCAAGLYSGAACTSARLSDSSIGASWSSGLKVEQLPVDGDLAAADAEEAAEIDHRAER